MLWLNVNLSSRKKKPLVRKETKTKKRFVSVERETLEANMQSRKKRTSRNNSEIRKKKTINNLVNLTSTQAKKKL